MKVTITIEDAPKEEAPNNLDIEFDFDPPVNDSSESTCASQLASILIEKIGRVCGENRD